MAEESPLLHVDTDWKKQAQEEKRKLAEQTAAKAAAAPAVTTTTGAAAPSAAKSTRRAAAEVPVANFSSLVQSTLTQVLYYLGDLASATGQQRVDVDMAKYQLDLLSLLEDKTRNNLTPDEVTLLDAALYEGRNRFVNVASQLLGP